MVAGKDWKHFLYGGVASCVAECGTFPIDTTKTRLQIQGQSTNKILTKLKYNGMLDCMIKIVKEEGPKALYRGITPALFRQSCYGTLKFGTYYTMKGIIMDHNDGRESVILNMICAVSAGVVSSAIANPTDVLKVRLQAQGLMQTESINLFGIFREIYTNEGVIGFWKGVSLTAQRAAVVAAVELPVYDFCKYKLINHIGDNIYNHFISSFIAACGCAIASTPIDVVRTRVMNQRKGINTGPLYMGTFDCALKTFNNEGIFAFYKGFIPTMFRMGPWNMIFFITFEQLKRF